MLTTNCPECAGEGHYWQPRTSGNDPSGRTIRCECDDGLVPVLCDGCDDPALTHYEGVPVCLPCLIERRAEETP